MMSCEALSTLQNVSIAFVLIGISMILAGLLWRRHQRRRWLMDRGFRRSRRKGDRPL